MLLSGAPMACLRAGAQPAEAGPSGRDDEKGPLPAEPTTPGRSESLGHGGGSAARLHSCDDVFFQEQQPPQRLRRHTAPFPQEDTDAGGWLCHILTVYFLVQLAM